MVEYWYKKHKMHNTVPHKFCTFHCNIIHFIHHSSVSAQVLISSGFYGERESSITLAWALSPHVSIWYTTKKIISAQLPAKESSGLRIQKVQWHSVQQGMNVSTHFTFTETIIWSQLLNPFCCSILNSCMCGNNEFYDAWHTFHFSPSLQILPSSVFHFILRVLSPEWNWNKKEGMTSSISDCPWRHITRTGRYNTQSWNTDFHMIWTQAERIVTI
jgi:hypothetical protein